MTEPIKDSVEVALDLDEKEVYSHIAHESAEDIIRIISSLDAERAKLHGEVIYYVDDWDDLIRERISKGKRHTAFDFYNPALLDIWEEKVEEIKKIKRKAYATYAILGFILMISLLATVLFAEPYLILGLSILPALLAVRGYARERLDLVYYELTQFFINELKFLIENHSLPPQKYRFKIFTSGYFGISTKRAEEGTFAVVTTEKSKGND